MTQRAGGSITAAPGGDARADDTGTNRERLEPLRRIELLARLSGAFDLAESQQLGHAARVAHIALQLADRIGIEEGERDRLLYVALLHDAGVAVRELPGEIDPVGGHTAAGAWAASLFGLDDEVQHAIRATHERWDGEGRPRGLAMAAIPDASLFVAAAHWVSDQIAPEDNPLRARARVMSSDPRKLGPMVGQRIANALIEELHSDSIWMPLWDDRLPALLADSATSEDPPSLRTVEQAAVAVGDLVDASSREPGRSRRVASLASALAAELGLSAEECASVGIAGHVMDIGQLGVPRHIGEKPDILSVDEMEVMRRHPGWGAQLLDRVPGFGQVAEWVQHHHERPDARGYPFMLGGTDVPLPSYVLAVSDAYWALRADRSDRLALPAEEALRVIEDGVDEQFAQDVVSVLPAALASLEATAAA